MKKIQNAEKLIKDVEKKIMNSEYGSVTLKGVKNLSRSDLETIIMYAQTFIKNYGEGFYGLMEPRGQVEELFKKYNVI
jgi:hypothetical protein